MRFPRSILSWLPHHSTSLVLSLVEASADGLSVPYLVQTRSTWSRTVAAHAIFYRALPTLFRNNVSREITLSRTSRLLSSRPPLSPSSSPLPFPSSSLRRLPIGGPDAAGNGGNSGADTGVILSEGNFLHSCGVRVCARVSFLPLYLYRARFILPPIITRPMSDVESFAPQMANSRRSFASYSLTESVRIGERGLSLLD